MNNKGFTLFIAITLMATLLLIAAGVVSLAVRQSFISTSGRESQHAFYAADTGIECALFWDIQNPAGYSAFSPTTGSQINCNNQTMVVGGNVVSTLSFNLLPDPYCAVVTVTKGLTGSTTIESRGYNTCSSLNPRRVERAIRAIYAGAVSAPSSWRYIKFHVTVRRVEPPPGCTQISEFTLLSDSSVVPWPNGSVATNPGGSTPGNEGPAKAIDNNLTTKICDLSTTGGNPMTLVVDTGSSVVFNGYKYGTGNDVPQRDPITWTVEGSNNNVNWTVLDTKTNQTNDPGRNTYNLRYNF